MNVKVLILVAFLSAFSWVSGNRAQAGSGVERLAAQKSNLWNHSDTEWTRWIVVSVAPTRIYFEPWSDERRSRLFEDFDPDHLDMWSGPATNGADFFRGRGVAVNSPMEYEYQELINPVYGHKEIFTGNGIARKEDGTVAGRYFRPGVSPPCMCHMAPLWHEVVAQGVIRNALHGDSIFQDNIANSIYTWSHGFCDWCNRRFISYMVETFGPEQLAGWGFDAETFHIRAYLRAQRRNLNSAAGAAGQQYFQEEYTAGSANERLLTDPIIREYVRFQHMAFLGYWVDIAERAKQTAARLDKPIPACYGNIPRVSGLRTFPTLMAGQVDIVWSEESTDMQPCFRDDRQAWSALLYKVGRAAGYHDRPVITCQYQGGHKSIYPEPGTKRMPTAIVCAEAVANGGVLCQTWSATEYNHLMDRPGWDKPFYETHQRHAAFAGANRVLFTDRTPVAEVALVYSFPCTFWREFQSLSTAAPHKDVFSAAARVLEDNHIPYEIMLLGHPDVFDDTFFWDRLGRYRTIVLPHVDALAREHEQRLAAWVRQGGHLVLLQPVGITDEELNERDGRAFADLAGASGAGSMTVLNAEQTQSLTSGQSILPTSKANGATWAYTFERPLDDWVQPDFDEASWQRGPGPFGDRTIRQTEPRTKWDSDDIWLRREFVLNETPYQPVLYLQHWWDVEVYINGVPAAVRQGRGYSFEPYQYLAMSDAAAQSLRPGRNLLAVHCRLNQAHPTYGKFIDVGIRDWAPDHALAEALTAKEPLLTADLPKTVWLNAWRHGAGPMISVQMVNYDVDLLQDRMRPVEPFALELRKQGPTRYDTAYYFSNDFTADAPAVPQVLPVTDTGDAWRVEVPGLTVLGVLVLASPEELDARTAAAQTRKVFERLRIARRCPGAAATIDEATLDEAAALLAGIQGDVIVKDFGAQTKPLHVMTTKLQRMLDGCTQAVQDQQQAVTRAALDVPAVARFDFGGPTAPDDWVAVAPETLYTPEAGYGWLEKGPLTVVDTGKGDAVHADYIRNVGPTACYEQAEPAVYAGRFKIDCPNGMYRVTIITGSNGVLPIRGTANEGRISMTFVRANGVLQALGDTLRSGYFQNKCFIVAVQDGSLLLEFYGKNIGPLYANTIQWLVNGVLLQTLDQPPTLTAAADLAAKSQHKQSAITAWQVLGPVADPHALAIQSPITLAQAWADATANSGEAPAWQDWRHDGHGMPIVPLSEWTSLMPRAYGFAHTTIDSNRDQDAVLLGSCSQYARVYLNGREVYRDDLAAGLLPQDIRVAVQLRRGDNELIVQTGHYWGREWSLWLGLTSISGQPLNGVTVRSEPPSMADSRN